VRRGTRLSSGVCARVVAFGVLLAALSGAGCQRNPESEAQRVVIDLTKYLAQNLCPGVTPELPLGNQLTVKLPDDVPPGDYVVVVRAGDPRDNVGAKGVVAREDDGTPVLRVSLDLMKLTPGPYTFSFGANSRDTYYCDIQLQ
jgi:hypothetical protein